MHEFNRRDFVFLSSGAALGNMVVSGVASAADDGHAHGPDFSHSGLVTGKPKPLKYKSIPGFLSAQQIAPHHTAHYGGALRGYTAADAKIASLDTTDKRYPQKVMDALEEYAIEASISKIFGSESMFKIADHGVQIYGGNGYSEEYPMAGLYRDCRIDRIFLDQHFYVRCRGEPDPLLHLSG